MELTPEMTIEQAAAVLGLHPTQIRRRIRQGLLPGRRVGARVWVIPRDAVSAAAAVGKLPPGRKPRQYREERP